MCKNKNMVTRFFSFLMALVMSFALIPAISAHAQETNLSWDDRGWAIALQRIAVYDWYFNVIGYIGAGEGFTVIEADMLPNNAVVYCVDYSTSGGTKSGYVLWDAPYIIESSTTCTGVANATTTVYYGKNIDQYQVVGSVGIGEYVSILAEAAGKYCIEYNTNYGRKRGWCSKSTITKKLASNNQCTLGQLPCNATFVNTNRTYSSRDVYAGPSTAYYKVGAIGISSPAESVYITAEYTYNGQKWAYISYSVPNQKDKSGYIRID